MENMYTANQICIINDFRKLWEQHVYWTRFFIISTAADLDDLKYVTARLLQNPGDFAKIFKRFYGEKIAECFKKLFTEHLTIAGELVNAAKNKEIEKVKILGEKWYKNAEDISCFLAEINPFWSEEEWKKMMFCHLEMTEKEVVLRLMSKYSQDIMIFDEIEKEALKMADCMSRGIISQFRYK